MADQFTSTSGKRLFKVRIEPDGDVFFVQAANSIAASQQVHGIVALNELNFNGSFDVNPATTDEIKELMDAGEEE